ncbi:MAG: GNAT family N-acetyltransferase, partial [Erysipelotrichaceae bacterium]|nr:GNAT family N-acetyltransferase [Erysipelotrichaceae bacterium]
MIVRRAEERDIPKILDLLVQVLNIHAEGRPDLFIPNTTKYTVDELKVMIQDDNAPIFVADENGEVLGYAFTVMQRRLHNNNMTDIKTLFIDDLCVDEKARGKHVGRTI